MYPEQILRMVNDIHESRRREAEADRLARSVTRSRTAVEPMSIVAARPASAQHLATSR